MKDTEYGNEFMKYGFDEFVKKELDDINYPKHYTFGKYEPKDVIRDWNLNFSLGNVIKYVARAKYKGNELKDLKKARFYLDDEIKALEKRESEKYCEEID